MENFQTIYQSPFENLSNRINLWKLFKPLTSHHLKAFHMVTVQTVTIRSGLPASSKACIERPLVHLTELRSNPSLHQHVPGHPLPTIWCVWPHMSHICAGMLTLWCGAPAYRYVKDDLELLGRVSFFLLLPADARWNGKISCENNVRLWHCKHINVAKECMLSGIHTLNNRIWQ